MPPPMPNPAKRMTAQPSRPVQRYRPGKAVVEEESSDEDEESEEERRQQQQQRQQQRKQTTSTARPVPQQRAQATKGGAEEDDDDESDDDEEGFVTDPEDGEGEEEKPKEKVPRQKTLPVVSKAAPEARIQSRPIEQSDDEDEDGEDSSDEDDDDDEDDSDASSSSPEPARKFQRPTFIRKSERTNTSYNSGAIISASAGLLPPDAASSDHDGHQTQTAKDRKVAEADIILREKLERDAAARAAGRRAWDDDENPDNDNGDGDEHAPVAMVDDTDGLDPAAEHAAWRLRELKRLKRDREAMVAREREIEEVERRRNLTAEEREAEDREFLARQKEERSSSTGGAPARVLAKYHHKGAFFRGGDDETVEALARRNIMGATFEDDVADKAALPEYMRVRDMAKLGRKGRTRYKDLKSEDTGRFGDDDRSRRWDGSRKDAASQFASAAATAAAGIDERFLPDSYRDGPRISGANASALGTRRAATSPSRRKRSPDRRSPDWDRDKRRRVDAVS